MQHDELIGKVQALARLPDRGSAEHTTRAVLTTLAERVPPGLAEHLAAQLPPGLAAPVTQVATEREGAGGAESRGERFDLTAYAGRVAARAGTTDEAAVQRSAAVLEVLDAAVVPEVMEKVTAVLPADIREMLPPTRAAGPEGAAGTDQAAGG